jgi:hypothetical protein
MQAHLYVGWGQALNQIGFLYAPRVVFTGLALVLHKNFVK